MLARHEGRFAVPAFDFRASTRRQLSTQALNYSALSERQGSLSVSAGAPAHDQRLSFNKPVRGGPWEVRA